MSDDKMAAYTTLREVLDVFLKCAAPFAPFITEKIWLEMRELGSQSAEGKMQNLENSKKNSLNSEF
jgi:isoleucyl-tRNA synthetase